IRRFGPQAVIHAAALTDTSLCEQEPATAHRINAFLAGKVAEICAANQLRLLFISTNEVFDGSKGSPYLEGDAPNPVNEYGRSKLAGEEAIREAHPGSLIVRTSWLYAAGGHNFPA